MKKQLLLWCVMLCCAQGFIGDLSAQKVYVVSVGIADYKEITDLHLTENDVKTFNALFSGQKNVEVKTLLGSQATHVNVIAALRSSFAKAQQEDLMIFFFSGHGYEGGFCCWDMSGKSPWFSNDVVDRNQLAMANRSYGGLSYEEMQILFRNCRAGRKLVIADACHSGGLLKGEQLNLTLQSARNGEVVYFLSSRLEETSLEMKGDSNGLFTKYVAKGLRGESDANSDGHVTLKEIYDYVYRSVVGIADQANHNQHPVLWGKYNDNMIIYKIMK